MSYTERHRGTVSGSRTVSVSYPASERGGSTSVTVEIDIPVNVEITVETAPFDRSVSRCASGVAALTGAVVASEAAQVAARTLSARRISERILGGFFSYIRSELSQQVSENRARCTALFLKLRDMNAACSGATANMEKDYARISSRYADLFSDLDKELRTRVHSLDRGAFGVAASAADQIRRPLAALGASVPTVVSAEDNQARAALSAGTLRRGSLALIDHARTYLDSDRQIGARMRSILTTRATDAESASPQDRCLPVLYMESDGQGRAVQQTVFSDSAGASPMRSRDLTKLFAGSEMKWTKLTAEDRSRIEQFLVSHVAGISGQPGTTEARIGATILRMWKSSEPKVLDHEGAMSAQGVRT